MNNEPLRILLADDEETAHLLFKKAFEKLKIKTSLRIVNNGDELMDYLSKKAALLPHLLFLDLNMPLKNGLKCLKEIRSNEKFNEVFIAIFFHLLIRKRHGRHLFQRSKYLHSQTP